MTPLPQAFFRSYVLGKTSDNLLSYLLLDSRVGAVVHSEQYFFFFIPTQGTYLKPKVQGTLVYLYVTDFLTFSPILYLSHLKTLIKAHY